jgi:hypothetical protein
MGNTSNTNSIFKGFVGTKTKIPKASALPTENIKNLECRQIAKECSITNQCKTFVDDINLHIFACVNQPFRLALFMDESADARNDVRLSMKENLFLRNNADPPAVDFVEEVLEQISIANRDLKSFKLDLKLEPADGGGAA